MRIPEPLFVILNSVVRVLLKSPLHFLMSDNILLIHYVGRKSGAQYCTPVRYIRTDSCIRCITVEEVQWWRNVQVEPTVALDVGGTKKSFAAHIRERDPIQTQQLILEFLTVYPQDAVYQEIQLNSDGSLNSEDLAKASHKAVVVDFEEA